MIAYLSPAEAIHAATAGGAAASRPRPPIAKVIKAGQAVQENCFETYQEGQATLAVEKPVRWRHDGPDPPF